MKIKTKIKVNIGIKIKMEMEMRKTAQIAQERILNMKIRSFQI